MWQKLNTFINVVNEAGFAKAAKKLALSTATVTRYIQELETEYNTKLFTRTTRHISLTQAGETFYRYAIELLQVHDEAQAVIAETENKVQGHVKIGLPVSILQHFAKLQLPQLMKTYPELSIEIIQGNHLHDLLSGHFDVVVHCGLLPDVNYYYEELGSWQKILCAAPAYLKKHGTPRMPTALKNHHCLDHADNQSLCWPLLQAGSLVNVPVISRIKMDSSLALKELAIQGGGIAYLPSFTVQDAITEKKLMPILKSSWQPALPVYALYPLRKQHNKKVVVIIQSLKQLIN